MRVAVIGMGRTGLPIAVALLKKGCGVVGVEIDERRLRELRNPDWAPAENSAEATSYLKKLRYQFAESEQKT